LEYSAHSKAGDVAFAVKEDEPWTLRVTSLEKEENGSEPVIETLSSWSVAVVALRWMKWESVVPVTRTTPSDGVIDVEPHVNWPLAAIRLPAEMSHATVMTDGAPVYFSESRNDKSVLH
jgi:hypothetical protein